MKSFDSAREVDDFIKQAIRDSDSERGELCDYQSKTRAYYLGSQWISQNRPGYRRFENRVDRAFPNWNAEQGPIRAVVNRTTRNTIGVASATNPSKIDVDALVSAYNVDSDTKNAAFAAESLTNQVIESSGLLSAARRANFERTVCGMHGLGVRIEELPGGDKMLKCYDFDASRLVLDPGVESLDLMDHEYVIYTEVVTIHKLKRMLGEEWVAANIKVDNLSTVGQLMPNEMAFARITNNAMYRRYAEQSSTKAAQVSWMYCKDRTGRFGYMYISIDDKSGKPLVYNMDDPVSPYGGCGLPFVLLRGHTRPGTRLPISDVGMMMGDQDRLNLLATLFLQQAYHYTAGKQWIVDKRAFDHKKSDEDAISHRLDRRVIYLDGSSSASPPQLITPPEPSANMDNMMRMVADDVRQQGFRSEASEGRLKSHVPATTWQATQELSNLPLDDRIDEDVRQYERLCQVLLGTSLMFLRQRQPFTSRLAVSSGLSDFELYALDTLNPYDMPLTIKLRQQAIRKRSRSQRRQDLMDAISAQAIPPDEMRFILAEELDTPLSEGDKRAARFASRVAAQVRDGEEWVPKTLGNYSQYVIRAFQYLVMEDRTYQIDGAVARLEAAIVAQKQHDIEQMMEEQAMLQGGEQPPQPAQPDPFASASIEQMLMGADVSPQTFA